ncbi:MAG: Ig-like domain-containing protein [Theionarchaea archaeon]|nr:Ig-like domain-containing protein [Theionarchaea archaeon]
MDNISYYVTITNPANGSTVSGTVSVTTDTNCDEVKFYIDGTLVKDDTASPFDYTWDTTGYSNGTHTILAEGYVSGTLEDSDSVTVTVENITYYITITNPPNGSTVSGTVIITVDTNCDEVRFYIDGTFVYDDTSSPFQYTWDTTAYPDGNHTIMVEGYVSGTLEDTDSVTVTVDNVIEYYLTITNPSDGEVVSDTVTITTDTNCEEVRFYIDGSLVGTDYTAPFQYSWDTTDYSDGNHTILAEGYASSTPEAQDTVTCEVDNGGSCLGTTLVFMLVLFGSAALYRRR